MLVRVNVQCNDKNETHSGDNREYGNHHYESHNHMIMTCGPESLHLIHPHAFASISEVVKLFGNSITYYSQIANQEYE